MNEWTDAEARVERARDLYDRGRWAEAAAELRAAIEINPHNADWHFNLALTLDAMEEYERAADAYRAAIDLEPQDVETLNCLGMDMTRMGRYAEALGCFEQIDRIDPDYEPAYCNRIITYTEIGEHDKAELMFYMARQLKEHCPLCYYNIGSSFFARQQYAKAIHCWEQALSMDTELPGANARIAEAHWAAGDLARARRHYAAELSLNPGDVDVLLDFGRLLMELKEHEEAGEKFRRVLEQAPEHAAAHFALGQLALARDRLVEAEDQFRLVLRVDADYPGAHARLGQLLLRRGETQLAAKHLLAELKRCGDQPAMLRELGQLLIEAQQVRQAGEALRRLVTLAPDDAHAHHNLAVSCFMLGELDDGISHCRRALKLKSDYPLALYNLALAHLQKNMTRRARRYASKALALAPTDEQVRRLCGRLGLLGAWTRLKMRLLRRG
jgi:superkiller protein 3